MVFLALIVIGVAGLWAAAHLWLTGENLSAFDVACGERFDTDREPGAPLQAIVAMLSDPASGARALPMRGRIPALRRYIEEMFAHRPYEATFTPVDCAGVPGEWVSLPGADPRRRTLYIHGGAFIIGSPRSHRTLTTRFAAMTGGVVLAIDYRLMPEHPRRAGIDDCRTAYRWMLNHGPQGPQPARTVFVAGESAGGNLTLSLLAWARDHGVRAPDAAVAMSPATDGTLGSPSLRAHLHSDPMLGPMFGTLARIPRWLLLWAAWAQCRIRPNQPVVSPVYGDLSGLPPVLVQVSEVEMLYDDARRYVNRARAAGSPVRLQSWNHVVHAWQIFNPELPQALHALEEVGKFLAGVTPLASAVPVSTAPVPDQPRAEPVARS